jgi:CBS domain-containing protein
MAIASRRRSKETPMKVKDVMTSDVASGTPDTSVAEAAHLMWERDCGILPVVDGGELAGVVTDRDMYIALATRNERAAHLRIGALAATKPATCGPDDEIRAALEIMRQARVRRLPVVGPNLALVGILSMNDLVLAAGPGKDITSDDIVRTLQAICEHGRPKARAAGA